MPKGSIYNEKMISYEKIEGTKRNPRRFLLTIEDRGSVRKLKTDGAAWVGFTGVHRLPDRFVEQQVNAIVNGRGEVIHLELVTDRD